MLMRRNGTHDFASQEVKHVTELPFTYAGDLTAFRFGLLNIQAKP